MSLMLSTRLRPFLLATAVLLPGCSGLQNAFNGGPRISDQVWLQHEAPPAASSSSTSVTSSDFTPYECTSLPSSDTPQPAYNGTPQTASSSTKLGPTAKQLNQCVDAMTLLINVRWYHFAADLTAVTSGTNFLLDVAGIGLGGAGSFAGRSASQILNAISGGLSGTKAAINEDLLYKNSITLIVHQMIADRSTAYEIILNKEAAGWNNPDATNAYHSLDEVAKDLYDYTVAGTWSHALASLQTSSAANANACQKHLKAKKMQLSEAAPGGGKGKKKGHAASSSDGSSPTPCNATSSDSSTTATADPESMTLAQTAGANAAAAASSAGADSDTINKIVNFAIDQTLSNLDSNQDDDSAQDNAAGMAIDKYLSGADKKRAHDAYNTKRIHDKRNHPG